MERTPPAATVNHLALLVGRMGIAALFLPSGFSKLMNLEAFMFNIDGRGVPFAPLVAPLAAGLEFLGGLALLLGVEVRIASVLLLAFTAAATLIAHRFWEYPPGAAHQMQQTSFFKNVAIVGGFVFLVAHGGGRYCLEQLWRRDRRARYAGRRATDGTAVHPPTSA
ncbi:MAG TPA: DoxX family protein [Burkholderiales bacterium]|nr:DoxX family protein [Burkholderiales bacterium]